MYSGFYHLKIITYICYEKDCPTKMSATMSKGIVGNGGLRLLEKEG